MLKNKIDINIEPRQIRVQYDAIRDSPYGRFYTGLLYFGFGFVMICLFLFAPGKHRAPSVWQDLQSNPVESFGFLFPMGILLVLFPLIAWLLVRALQVTHPGAQRLEFDGATLTVSCIRWMDWKNEEWVTKAYLLRQIWDIRYGVLVSRRGNSIHGLRFRTAGRNYKLFPKLTTVQAGKILAGFEAMGADTGRQRKKLPR
jgi:hypothetical protein